MMDAATLTQQLISTLRRYEAAWLAYKLDDPMRAQLRTEARQLRQRAYAPTRTAGRPLLAAANSMVRRTELTHARKRG